MPSTVGPRSKDSCDWMQLCYGPLGAGIPLDQVPLHRAAELRAKGTHQRELALSLGLRPKQRRSMLGLSLMERERSHRSGVRRGATTVILGEEDWPAPRASWSDENLVRRMRTLREVVRLARRVREQNGLKHRCAPHDRRPRRARHRGARGGGLGPGQRGSAARARGVDRPARAAHAGRRRAGPVRRASGSLRGSHERRLELARGIRKELVFSGELDLRSLAPRAGSARPATQAFRATGSSD